MENTLTRKVLFEKTSNMNKKKYETQKRKEAVRKIMFETVYSRYIQADNGKWVETGMFEDMASVIKRAITLNAKYIILGNIETDEPIENNFFLLAFKIKEFFMQCEFCSEMNFEICTIMDPKEFAKDAGIPIGRLD